MVLDGPLTPCLGRRILAGTTLALLAQTFVVRGDQLVVSVGLNILAHEHRHVLDQLLQCLPRALIFVVMPASLHQNVYLAVSIY